MGSTQAISCRPGGAAASAAKPFATNERALFVWELVAESQNRRSGAVKDQEHFITIYFLGFFFLCVCN